MPRDSQRSRVYAWEREVKSLTSFRYHHAIEDAQQFMDAIWVIERARFDRAGHPPPRIFAASRRRHRPTANNKSQRIKLPEFAREEWTILHEMAHCILPPGIHHGPRFVATFMGMACRHLKQDLQLLQKTADAHGVAYDRRCLGPVPAPNLGARAIAALKCEGAMTPMDLSCWLSTDTKEGHVSERQLRAALLWPIRRGEARLLRGKVVALV